MELTKDNFLLRNLKGSTLVDIGKEFRFSYNGESVIFSKEGSGYVFIDNLNESPSSMWLHENIFNIKSISDLLI